MTSHHIRRGVYLAVNIFSLNKQLVILVLLYVHTKMATLQRWSLAGWNPGSPRKRQKRQENQSRLLHKKWDLIINLEKQKVRVDLVWRLKMEAFVEEWPWINSQIFQPLTNMFCERWLRLNLKRKRQLMRHKACCSIESQAVIDTDLAVTSSEYSVSTHSSEESQLSAVLESLSVATNCEFVIAVEESGSVHSPTPPSAPPRQFMLTSYITPQQATQLESEAHLTAGTMLPHTAPLVFDMNDATTASVFLLGNFHIVVFAHSAMKFNEIMLKLNRHFNRDVPYADILGRFGPVYADTDTILPEFSQELSRIQAAITNPDHQRQICVELLLNFVRKIEKCIANGSIPFSDAPAITFLPLTQEMKFSLNECLISCFQIQLSHVLTFEQTIALLLSCAKIIASCATDSDVLKVLEIEDQCFIFVENSAYLCTKHNKLGALIKVFPEHCTAFCTVAASNDKATKDCIDSFLNRLPKYFASQYQDTRYKCIEIFRQAPSEAKPLISPWDYSSDMEAVCMESATLEQNTASLAEWVSAESSTPLLRCAMEEGPAGSSEVVGYGSYNMPVIRSYGESTRGLPQEGGGVHYFTEQQAQHSAQLVQDLGGYSSDSEHFQYNAAPSNDDI